MTVETIINSALQQIGVLIPGEMPAQEMRAAALAELDKMFDRWNSAELACRLMPQYACATGTGFMSQYFQPSKVNYSAVILG